MGLVIRGKINVCHLLQEEGLMYACNHLGLCHVKRRRRMLTKFVYIFTSLGGFGLAC